MTEKIALKKDFELIERIGKGVSSEVYKGLRVDQETDFSQVVAIKVFKSTKFRKKFQNELKNLSKIAHPNIVSVKDWGEHNQRFFLVTEYIHGKDLLEIMGSPYFKDIKLKKYVLNQIFNGIKELKNKGIAHGDLKPSNVMLSVTGEVKLVDISFDDLGQVFATPEFTAPEVLSGLNVSFKSDLYSLGVIAQKLDLNQNKLLSLEPGDRTFSSYKISDEGECRKKLSELVRNIDNSHSDCGFEYVDTTQELQSHDTTVYKSSFDKPQNQIEKMKKSVVVHIFIFLGLSLSLVPKNPEVKTIKLRSLHAYEIWNEKEWVSLPVDFNHFDNFTRSNIKLRLRNAHGEQIVKLSSQADLSKNIIVGAPF